MLGNDYDTVDERQKSTHQGKKEKQKEEEEEEEKEEEEECDSMREDKGVWKERRRAG